MTPSLHWRMNWEWYRVVGARYGVRGVRVGEASHPGPPDHDEWTAPDSVIDVLEADLTPPVASTIPASVGAVMRRMQGDVPAVRGSRFVVLPESDVENDEPVRPVDLTAQDSASAGDLSDTVSLLSEGPEARTVTSGTETEWEYAPREVFEVRPSAYTTAALASLDLISARDVFGQRACIMKVPPGFCQRCIPMCDALGFARDQHRNGIS